MAGAARRISALLSRSFSPSSESSSSALPHHLRGRRTIGLCAGICRFGTAAVLEEPIQPPVRVDHNQLLINGHFVDAASGKTFPTFDPRTGEVITHVAEADVEDVDRAVAAARKAFDEGPWPRMTAYERSKIIYRSADLIEKHIDEIAALETWDNGKTYEQASQVDIPMVVRVLRYYAGWADKIHGLVVPADGPHHVQVLHEPIGVAGQIIPWNFPLLLLSWKVGPALACGNTIVVKTAELTPLSAWTASFPSASSPLPDLPRSAQMRPSMIRSIHAAVRSSVSTSPFSSASLSRRSFSSESHPERKVAVLGAAGGIGQPLALLMKQNPLVSSLALYDIAGTPGVAADVSHVNTRALVKGYMSDEQLGEALEGTDMVIIPAGVPRKPGMTRDDLFNINAGIVKGLCTAISKHCPNAIVNMISNPVNSTVPIASEVFKKAGTYDEKKLFGVTTLDVVRAKTFYAGKANIPVSHVNVSVVGGHAGITILPLFSQATPTTNALSAEDIKALTKRTQDGGTEVVEAKAGKGSATLSMAYAGALFADACLKGLNGAADVVECSFVQSTVTELPFFASKVKLGKNGAEEVYGMGPLSDFEKEGLDNLKAELKSSIEKGIKFAQEN